MTRPADRVAWMAVVCLFAAIPAGAQQSLPRAPGPPRFELSAGVLYAGGYPLDSADANIIRNQTGGPPYTLFTTDTSVEDAPGFEGRFGVRLSRLFTVEGGAFTSRPQLRTHLSDDVESAPDLTAVEDLSLYIIDAALLVSLGSWSGGRVTPYARAGGGYLRQLHEDNALVETGFAYHAGGGLTVWLTRGSRPLGVRMDARVYVLGDGIDLGTGTRTMATGGGAIVFAF